jgi:F-type H+-transporting ATPase subunit delta
MNDSKISVRYARALFESAIEKKLLDNVYQDMIFILGVCKLPEMKEMLESPVIIPSKKIDILNKVFGKNVEKITFSLVELAVKNGRENFLAGIARVFIQNTKEYKGITESTLTTAVSIDSGVRQQIIDFISGAFRTKVELSEVVDIDIIGGFILRIEDNYIDASVRNKLRKIGKALRGNSLYL